MKVLTDQQVDTIAERYGISSINALDATHYKLCLVIHNLEERLAKLDATPSKVVWEPEVSDQ